jgi:hypothetical protein
MWYSPTKYDKPIEDVNKLIANIKGELEEKEARILLAKFLYRNLGITTELLTGIRLYPDQIINIKGMLQSNYTMCVWGRGLGKCALYADDTKLLTKDDGLISITDLVPDIDFSLGERWIEIPKRLLWNGEKYVEVTKVLVQPRIPATKVTTRCGYSFSGSTRHLIRVWNKESLSPEWKRYSELTTEDFVCISRNHLPESSPVKDLEKNEAYLIGLLLGNGSMSSNGFSITSEDEEILRFVEKYPVGKRCLDTRTANTYSINFKDDFIEYLTKKYDLKPADCYHKEIPKSVLINKELSKACLQGLLDTNGFSSKDILNVEFCSTSVKMAKQVHLLLSLFGIVGKMREKKTNSHFGKAFVINLFGKDVVNFHNSIGFRLSRKRDNIQGLLGTQLNTNIDIIPGAKEYCQKNIKSKIRLPKLLSDKWRNKIRRKDNQIDISYATLEKYRDFFKEVSADALEIRKLNSVIDNNYFFDKIESIEDLGTQNCIDFNVPDGECYWGNGFINHNTFSAAMFCILQSIFFPKSSILIAGPTFRTARFIFNHIEKICDSPDAQLLFQAMGVKSKRNDEFKWSINGGQIIAIPLNGEKIRGFRANVLVIDEFLLMNEELVERVLMPYLVAPQDIKERQLIREKEDELIRRGVLKESERIKFDNSAKMIGLSSASYTCEYLYKKYDEFVKQIYSDAMPEEGAKYFVSQLSWDSVPSDRIDKSIIEMAKGNEAHQATFQREYGGQFIDGSESYFSMKKMIECTVPDGEEPTLLLKGAKDKKYILSIDPNFSNSPTADNFAMCVMEIDDDKIAEGKISGTVVHNYSKCGKDLKEHIKYFYYILKNFNVEMIIIDYAGYQFIEAANENELFKRDGIEIKIFDFYPEKDGAELEAELRNARRTLNKEIHRIAFTQYFTTDFIRKGNENLQGAIDYKKLWFGSGIKASSSSFERAIDAKVDLSLVGEDDASDLIDTQELLVKSMKYECASIEVKSTAKGTQSFDLPQIMRRDTSASRMRRDSYTALMLAVWGLKCWNDIQRIPKEDVGTFSPIFL